MLKGIANKNVCSCVLLDFLGECLHLDATKRPTCEAMLQHPFITQAITRNVINLKEVPKLKGLTVPMKTQSEIDTVLDGIIEL